jgi:hypothetical protein
MALGLRAEPTTERGIFRVEEVGVWREARSLRELEIDSVVNGLKWKTAAGRDGPASFDGCL